MQPDKKCSPAWHDELLEAVQTLVVAAKGDDIPLGLALELVARQIAQGESQLIRHVVHRTSRDHVILLMDALKKAVLHVSLKCGDSLLPETYFCTANVPHLDGHHCDNSLAMQDPSKFGVSGIEDAW